MLLVEDEASIRKGLTDVLRFHNCEVETAEDGPSGLEKGRYGTWDLIILDVMLPGMNGFEVCKSLREAGQEAAILMLTAKADEDDIVRGLEAGADDYVTKPFGVRELMARIGAQLRRANRHEADVIEAGSLKLDCGERIAMAGHETLNLTDQEFSVLAVLAEQAGRVVGRRRLLQTALGWNNVERIETRTVDVHIAKLRKKLQGTDHAIETVRGHGYRLNGAGET